MIAKMVKLRKDRIRDQIWQDIINNGKSSTIAEGMSTDSLIDLVSIPGHSEYNRLKLRE